MKKFISFFFVQTILFFSDINPLKSDVININNKELIELYKQDVPIVDIRTANEWMETGVIPNSHTLTFINQSGNKDINFWFSELSKLINLADPFIIICRSGNRSKSLSQKLLSKNLLNNFYNAKEGVSTWILNGGITIEY
tara:strand:+ start:354 stop:773 length:420 start_codon:yes stop_codon:yes gene_type:complete